MSKRSQLENNIKMAHSTRNNKNDSAPPSPCIIIPKHINIIEILIVAGVVVSKSHFPLSDPLFLSLPPFPHFPKAFSPLSSRLLSLRFFYPDSSLFLGSPVPPPLLLLLLPLLLLLLLIAT